MTNVGKQRAFAEVPLPSLERARLAAAQNWETMGQMGVVGGGAGARGGALRSVLGGARRRKNQEFRATLMAETTVVS